MGPMAEARRRRRLTEGLALLLLGLLAGCPMAGSFVDEMTPVDGAVAADWQDGGFVLPGGAHASDLVASDADALAAAILAQYEEGSGPEPLASVLEELSPEASTLVVRSVGAVRSVVATDRRFALRGSATGWTVDFVEIRHHCRDGVLPDGACR
jgi:hypothetical protein